MDNTRVGSKGLIRDLNRSLVLNIIASQGPISRIEVARKGGLTAATITNIVNGFVSAGLVSETTSEESSGGRPPILLRINPKAGYVVGIKLREFNHNTTFVLCDMECTVLYKQEIYMPQGVLPFQAVDILADVIDTCVHEAGIQKQDVLGIGVGASGLIDTARGLLRYSNFLEWRNVELGPALEYKTRVPVSVDNDVNTLAVAERHFGVARNTANCMLATIGRGVGLALVVNGEIYRGAYGSAGEFGHMTIDYSPDAPPCTCGKRGCLEAIVSDYGIARAALGTAVGYSNDATLQDLVDRANAGDTRLRDIFTNAGTIFGMVLANMINVFDPAQVILSGEGLRAGELLLKPIRESIPKHLFGDVRAEVPLIISATDDVSWARGAASVILREVFRPPIYETGKVLPIDTLLSRDHSRSRHKR